MLFGPQDRVVRYGTGFDPRPDGNSSVFWWISLNGEVRVGCDPPILIISPGFISLLFYSCTDKEDMPVNESLNSAHLILPSCMC